MIFGTEWEQKKLASHAISRTIPFLIKLLGFYCPAQQKNGIIHHIARITNPKLNKKTR